MKFLSRGALAAIVIGLVLSGTASAQMTRDGFITHWLLLGELMQPPGQVGNNPGVDNIMLDYLTDGIDIDEVTIMPEDGQEIEVDYGGAAASVGLAAGTFRGDDDFNGYPEWFEWQDADGHISFDEIFGLVDNVMTYAVTYVINTTGAPLPVTIGCGSDDSIQVYVNDESVHVNSIPRGYGGGVQDRVDALLESGLNRILVKVFEGGGLHNMGLRFEERGTQEPILAPTILVTTRLANILAGRDLPDGFPSAGGTVRILVWKEGDVGDVTVKVTERPPAGWAVSAISDGGSLAGGVITWNVPSASLPKTLTYTIRPPADEPGFFEGSYEGGFYQGEIIGEAVWGEAFWPLPGGYWNRWLILGQYTQAGWDNPGLAALAMDYLTDGTISEALITPSEGEEVETDYCGASASGGLNGISALADPDADDNGYPEWFAWTDADDTIDFTEIFGDANGVMTYAVLYVINATGEPIDCSIGVSSDDSVAVYINTDYVWAHSIPRGISGAGTDQDTAPCRLLPGKNRVMVKTFEGGGGFAMRFRFKDDAGIGIEEGLYGTFDPTGCIVPPVGVRRILPAAARLRSELPVTLQGVGSAAGSVTIRETVPAGWTIVDAAGGSVAGQTITWTRPAAEIGKITYAVRVPGAKFGKANFAGTFRLDAGAEMTTFGSREVSDGSPGGTAGAGFGTDGYITDWLILGPYGDQGGCDIGPLEINADYLTDGWENTQEDILPYEGMEVDTDFSIAASSVYYGRTSPEGIPIWHAISDNDGGINYNDEHMPGMRNDNVMAYAVCYVTNRTGDDIEAWIATGSDDALEVWFDGEVWTMDVCRGWNWPNPQEVNGPVTLSAGVQHRVMTKTFEQGGGWNFYLRFQDAAGIPITDGLEIGLEPETGGPRFRAVRTLDPIYAPGVSFPVTIAVESEAGALRIEETVPDGWTISEISAGGSSAGQVITWPSVPNGATVSYKVTPPASSAPAVWSGKAILGATTRQIVGDRQSVAEVKEEDVSPWTAKDIGGPLPGGVDLLRGTGTPDDPMDIEIWGSGADIWGTADAFRFVYIERGGDFTITAEVLGVDYTHDWAKAGVMIRSSACPNAMYAFMHITPANGNDFQYRLAVGGSAANAGQTGAGALVNWVRLVKIGSSVTAYRSADGISWTQHGVAQTIPGDRVLVGLAVTSHNAAAVTRAQFRNVVIEEMAGLCPSDVRATCGETGVVLTWRNNYDYARIRIYRVDATGASRRIASIAGTLQTYTDATASTLPAGLTTYKIIPVVGVSELMSCGECPDPPDPMIGENAQVCIVLPACTPARCCEAAGVRFIRADTDGTGVLTIGDGIQILERLFTGRPAFGSKCDKTGDFDDSGTLTIGDAISVFNFLFVAGSRLPQLPYPACGLDPTDDGLTCEGPVPACP